MKTAALPALFLLFALPSSAAAQDCSKTSVGFTPLNDLGTGTYQGFEGGLYPGGASVRPAGHEAAGLAQAALVVPRDAAGNPDPAGGKIVLLSIGLSNTSIEFSRLMTLAAADPLKDPRVVLVNGAQGGWAAEDIVDPAAAYWSNVDARLAASGVTPAQVQAVWLKEANRAPTEPFPQDAQTLEGQLEIIAGVVRSRYPNARLGYLASRIYAGYAVTNLNPEPFAYESGFAVKGLIGNQIAGKPALNFDPAAGAVKAPWLSWGPYLWADGLTPRSDGLIWECSDFQSDGTHPNDAGADKVAGLLLAFLQTDSTTQGWYLAQPGGIFLRQTSLIRGQTTQFIVSRAAPGEKAIFGQSFAGTGSGPCLRRLGGLCLDLLKPVSAFGKATADASGVATLSWTVPPSFPLADLSTQAVIRRGPGGADSVKTNFITAPVLP